MLELSKDGNTVHTIPNIEKTEVEYKTDDGKSETYTISGGYLDIGIMDTMKDLFVNFIGALTFSIFGYLYSRNDYRKFTFIRNFIPRKAK